MKINKSAKTLNQIGSHARQGDTLLRRIENIPTNKKQIKTPTLALGEVSGHHHTFRDNGAIAFADEEDSVVADFVSVTARGSVLTHEEHGAVSFPEGNYESLKQVEYTPKEIRQVKD